MSIERHYFPGNNTPMGFFSYYKHIIGQREANRIICVKGGPGTGKSTLMKKIALNFTEKDEDIDFLHCSADENSLDGIIIKNKKIALIDATSPHIMDPVTPGAVDKIVNLGDYWNEDGISQNKEEIIDLNEETSRWYRIAYNYLNAAKSVFRSIEEIYNNAAESSEIYRLVSNVISKVYNEREISLRPGRMKKFFASAITANGVIHYIPSLLEQMKTVYMISSPVGYSNNSFMEIIAEGAIYRGLNVEAFYCPMFPDEKIEHIIIPELKTAFVTLNEYHDVEPWEISDIWEQDRDIILLDMNDYMDGLIIDKNSQLVSSLKEEYDILLNRAFMNLKKAKETHLLVENMYVPNMNFREVTELIETITKEVEAL
ncbi:MAG: ATPase [Firmicutes bacterium]|nr:ATPase [Bacillota bacterium]